MPLSRFQLNTQPQLGGFLERVCYGIPASDVAVGFKVGQLLPLIVEAIR